MSQAFITAFNTLISKRIEMLAAYEEIRDTLFDEDEWAEKTQKAYEKYKQKTAALQNICASSDEKEYDEMSREADEAQEEYKKTAAECSAARYRFSETNHFYSKLKRQSGLLEEFDELLWYALVDYVKVNADNSIAVVFKDGTEI